MDFAWKWQKVQYCQCCGSDLAKVAIGSITPYELLLFARRAHVARDMYMPYIDGNVQTPKSSWTVVTFATLKFEFYCKAKLNFA